MQGCTGCPLDGQAKVLGQGRTVKPDLIIVGEAPGETEVLKREPFVGKVSFVLNNTLRGLNMSRTHCYITNAMLCRPPKNKADSKEGRAAREHCRPRLLEEIRSIEGPRRILALGNTALLSLTGAAQITERRGYAIQTDLGFVMPTYHPSYLVRGQMHLQPIFKHDIDKASRMGEGGELYDSAPEVNAYPTITQISKEVGDVGQNPYALDIETTRLGQLISVAVASRGKVFVIPFKNNDHSRYWSPEEEDHASRLLQTLLSRGGLGIYQNAPFDITNLRRLGYTIKDPVSDTMVMHSILWPEHPHKLRHLGSMYCNTSDWKGVIVDYDDTPDDVMRYYNAMDAWWTLQIHTALVVEMCEDAPEEGFSRAGLNGASHYFKHVAPLILPTIALGDTGAHVLKDRLEELTDEIDAHLCADKARMFQLCEKNINFNSPKQISEVLFTDLEAPKSHIPKTKTGFSTAEATLKRVARQDKKPLAADFAQALMNYREWGTLKKNFTNGLKKIVGKDGRIHPTFQLHRVETGRLSAKSPPIMNYPMPVRKVIGAPEGWIIVTGDYSQLEQRILAYVTDDEKLIEIFADPSRDCHLENAADLLGCQLNEVTPIQRKYAKVFIYSLCYGATYKGIASRVPKELDISEEQIKTCSERYFYLHPKIETYYKEVVSEVKATRKLQGVFGRTRYFLGSASDIQREAKNYMIQNAAADIMSQPMRAVWEWQDQTGLVQSWLQHHDALYVYTPLDIWEGTAAQLKDLMEYPVNIGGWERVFPVDIQVGPTWYDLEEWSACNEQRQRLSISADVPGGG